jgi:hypothetical protein
MSYNTRLWEDKKVGRRTSSEFLGLSEVPQAVKAEVRAVLARDGLIRARLFAISSDRERMVLPDVIPASILQDAGVTHSWYIHNGLTERPLSKEEQHRKRLYPPISSEFRNLGPRFGPGFSLMSRVLPAKEREYFRLWASIFLDHPFCLDDNIRTIGKIVGAWAKKNGDGIPYWKCLVNWETLGGYVADPPMDLFYDDIHYWVCGEEGADTRPGTTLPGWIELFDQGVNALCPMGISAPEVVSLEQWAYNADWGRQGVADIGTILSVSDQDKKFTCGSRKRLPLCI